MVNFLPVLKIEGNLVFCGVVVDGFIDGAVKHDLSVFHYDTAGAERFGNLRRMGDEQKRDVALHDLLHLLVHLSRNARSPTDSASSTMRISGLMLTQMEKPRRAFIPLEYGAHRLVNVFFELRKINDGRLELCDVFIVKAQNAALEVNVFAAGKFLVKAACELQKRADDAIDVNFAACGNVTPVIILSMVDLPAPLRPKMAAASPRSTVRFISTTACFVLCGTLLKNGPKGDGGCLYTVCTFCRHF